MRKQSAACVPSRGGASIRCARSWSACGRETHGYADAGVDLVDRYVSLKFPRKLKNFGAREPTILMARAAVCQRTVRLCYIRPSVPGMRTTQVTRMEFGLLPKFSTPVQKPVEIRVLRRTNAKKRRFYGHMRGAKVRRARFEATFGVPPGIRPRSAVWP